MKHAAFSTLEDIDLSLLTRFLCPESEVKDEEVPWTWDYLYTSICTELREEWALDDGEEDEQYDPQAATAQDDQRQRSIAA
uniref:Uncharacterized protein n=1 Tax=Plectus sambesii TaxID=2011161 RepID=A0A914UZ25_9BILA